MAKKVKTVHQVKNTGTMPIRVSKPGKIKVPYKTNSGAYGSIK